MNRFTLIRHVAAVALLLSSLSVSAATITIVNADGPGEGFNDQTPVSPVGGNPGTTLGEQRLNVFNYAAAIWANLIDSPVEIQVEALFDPLSCNSTSAVLGSAGTTTVHRDFSGALLSATWYPQALANAFAGQDLASGTPDLSATFNSQIDNNNSCLYNVNWYLGLDGNNGNDIDLADVVMHEIGHGLGFASYVNEGTGQLFYNYIDVFSSHLEDHSTGKAWGQMSNTERKASAIDSGDLHFVGPNVVYALGGGHAPMFAPNPVQPGSSVSHFDVSMTPNELMEPYITDPPIHNVGLADDVMLDLGWVSTNQPGNTAPVINITSPSSGAAFIEGTSINFQASASDTEDGDLSSTIRWVSDVDGDIGTGASIDYNALTVGDHIITASVTDSGPVTSTDQISITIDAAGAVSAPTAPSGVGVTDLTNGKAQVSWTDASDNEDQFDILREKAHRKRPGVWVSSTILGSVAAGVTSYTDNSGTGTFRYAVRSANAGGSSAWVYSDPVTITDSSGGGGGGGGGGGSFCDTHPNHRKCK